MTLGNSDVTLAWRTLSSTMAEAVAKQTNRLVKHTMTKGRAPHFISQDRSRGCKRCVGETDSHTSQESHQGLSGPARTPHLSNGSAMGTSPHLKQTGRQCA